MYDLFYKDSLIYNTFSLSSLGHHQDACLYRGNYTMHFCDVVLTVHLSIILVIDQLNAQIVVL